MMNARAHQPGSDPEPWRKPESVPNPAFPKRIPTSPEPAPTREPVKVPEKVPA